ncbi:MAG: ABC transporter permease subunit [Candidatus Eremiobacteraeota bacterium]|nr:ABC transporter permease subunit [Candidatus Eremiobacteraeota bacterium]
MLSDLLAEAGTHLEIAGAALAIAIAVGVPLALLTAKTRFVRAATLGGVGIARSLPTIAVLALLLPWLGVGRLPAILALALLALPPIAISVDAGMRSLSAAQREVADALGLGARTRFLRVEVPATTPLALAGLRTAGVECIASATLATFIGGGGLGDGIVRGLQTGNETLLLLTAGTVAVLAFAVDALLSLLARSAEAHT